MGVDDSVGSNHEKSTRFLGLSTDLSTESTIYTQGCIVCIYVFSIETTYQYSTSSMNRPISGFHVLKRVLVGELVLSIQQILEHELVDLISVQKIDRAFKIIECRFPAVFLDFSYQNMAIDKKFTLVHVSRTYEIFPKFLLFHMV